MKLLLIVGGLALVAWLSQLWDERARRTSKAQVAAALQETEALCVEQHARQAAYVDGYAPDARSMNASAGRAITPPSNKRSYRKAA